jgi:hypothetical protein
MLWWEKAVGPPTTVAVSARTVAGSTLITGPQSSHGPQIISGSFRARHLADAVDHLISRFLRAPASAPMREALIEALRKDLSKVFTRS